MTDQDRFFIACWGGGCEETFERLLRLEVDVHALGEHGFRWACREGRRNIAEHLLSLDGDRRINVHAKNEWAFRMAHAWRRWKVVELLLSLTGDRAIPGRVLTKYGVKDTPKRALIAEWACKRARGNAQHAVLRGLERAMLAEVLGLLARPW